MLREKTIKLMVAFPTTTDAMHMQIAARNRNLEGRMIPVPEEISAGCGLAWCAQPRQRSEIETIIREEKIRTEGYYEILW